PRRRTHWGRGGMREDEVTDDREEDGTVNQDEEQSPALDVPPKNGHAVDLVLDDLDMEGDEGSRMMLKEMQEAIDDESHPQHEEALRQSKKLADSMMPALESLRKQMSSQFDMSSALKRIKLSTTQSLGITGLSETVMKGIGSANPKDALPKMDRGSTLSKSAYTPTVIDSGYVQDLGEITDSIAEAALEREERAERQVEMAAAQLDTLQAMAANLQQLNQQMESVDQRLSQSNKSDGRSFGWTIMVGALTLVATIIGIVVTVILSRS
ncbi:MAG: hypothetical protein ACRCWS_08860, partial [Propionibacteriaceae bacterium]